MTGITLTQAEAQLSTWIDASTAVAAGQSISVGGKELALVNAKEIRENIKFWSQMVRRLGGTSGGIPVYGGTPVDA